MATLDGIHLFELAPTSGAAFLLTKPVKEAFSVFSVAAPDGWVAEARHRYVVVRKPAALAGYATIREAVLHGLCAAFAFFGCVPAEVWWDKATKAKK